MNWKCRCRKIKQWKQNEVKRVSQNTQCSLVENPTLFANLSHFCNSHDSKSWRSLARVTSAGRASRCTRKVMVALCTVCYAWYGTLEPWSQMNTSIYHNIIILLTIPRPNCTNTALTCGLNLKCPSYSWGSVEWSAHGDRVRCDARTNIGHRVE